MEFISKVQISNVNEIRKRPLVSLGNICHPGFVDNIEKGTCCI